MPLRQLLRHTAEDVGLHQILMAAGRAANKPVEQTVVEPCKQRRREAATSQQSVGFGFSYKAQTGSTSAWVALGGGKCGRWRKWQKGTRERGRGRGKIQVFRTFAVYEDLCAISVRPHQYSLIVYLFRGQPGFAIDDFEKL